MLISVIAYVVGVLLCAWALGTDRDSFCQESWGSRCKMFLSRIGVSLLWPIAGVFLLWETLDVWWIMTFGKKKYDI